MEYNKHTMTHRDTTKTLGIQQTYEDTVGIQQNTLKIQQKHKDLRGTTKTLGIRQTHPRHTKGTTKKTLGKQQTQKKHQGYDKHLRSTTNTHIPVGIRQNTLGIRQIQKTLGIQQKYHL